MEGSCKTGGDSHLAAGIHDPRSGETDVGATETATGHHQVADVLRVEGAEGNVVVALGVVEEGLGEKGEWVSGLRALVVAVTRWEGQIYR